MASPTPPNTSNSKTSTITNRIALITAIISLITASLSFFRACNNSKEIENLKGAPSVAYNLWEHLEIEFPENKTVITNKNTEISGVINVTLPEGYKLWILTRKSKFFLQDPPPVVTPTQATWSQNNVKLPIPGEWEIHVCVADENATKSLQRKISSGRGDIGFPELPPGLATVKYVKVTREQ